LDLVELREDDKTFVACLEALASLNRLLILRSLRTPRALSEIQVPDNGTGQPLARQTVRRHLDTLLDAGVVLAREGQRNYGDTNEFVVNHQRVFALAEEMRGLARLRPSVEPELLTLPATAASAPAARGPTLVLVHGLDEGSMFPLAPAREGETWVLGRRRGVAVSLDFDPSVSSEHATLTWQDGRPALRDLGSRNGTTHNLRPLAPQQAVRLSHGDLVGVGRSLLLYWS
jgi:DNA-binding transcriptional ArsR family regulator